MIEGDSTNRQRWLLKLLLKREFDDSLSYSDAEFLLKTTTAHKNKSIHDELLEYININFEDIINAFKKTSIYTVINNVKYDLFNEPLIENKIKYNDKEPFRVWIVYPKKLEKLNHIYEQSKIIKEEILDKFINSFPIDFNKKLELLKTKEISNLRLLFIYNKDINFAYQNIVRNYMLLNYPNLNSSIKILSAYL